MSFFMREGFLKIVQQQKGLTGEPVALEPCSKL